MKLKKQLSFFTCNVNYGTETKSENVIAYNVPRVLPTVAHHLETFGMK
jgi:hypothetical protein